MYRSLIEIVILDLLLEEKVIGAKLLKGGWFSFLYRKINKVKGVEREGESKKKRKVEDRSE